MHERKTILIIAGDHHGNLGDKAIVTATVEMLRSRLDRPQLYLAGNGSSSYWAPLGVDLVGTGASGFLRLLRAAKRSDLVICGGGGLFQDDDSRVKMPYWAARLAAIRPFARRIVGFCIGAGPLKYPASRRYAAAALRQLDSISVRDELANQVLAPLTSKPIAVVPDPALQLTPGADDIGKALLAQHGVPLDGRPLIGVAPRRWFHLRSQLVPHKYAHRFGLRPIPGAAECAEFIALLASVLDRLVVENGAHIVFLPTYNLAHEGDDQIAEQIAAHMRERAASIVRIDDPRIYKRVTQSMSVVLAARMHAAILAAGMGTPVVGLAYNQKFKGFLELLEPGAAPLTIDEFVSAKASNDLLDRLRGAIDTRDACSGRVVALRQRIADHVDDLLIRSGLR